MKAIQPDQRSGSGARRGRRLGVVDRTFHRLIDHGDLLAYRIGRLIRVRRQDLDGFLAENRVAPGGIRHLYPG